MKIIDLSTSYSSFDNQCSFLSLIQTDCKEDVKGLTYQGKTSVTKSELVCQRWDSKTPWTHNFVDSEFPDGNLQSAENYCRSVI